MPTISYNWTVQPFDNLNNPTTLISGFVSPNAGSSIPGENLVSLLLNPGHVTYTVTATFTANNLGCSGTANTYIVNVAPSPTVQPSFIFDTICSQSPSHKITFSANVSPVTYEWHVVDSTGVTNFIAMGTTDFIPVQTTIKATGATPGRLKYQITPIYSGGGLSNCPGGFSYSTIIVNPLPVTPIITGGTNPVARHTECENEQGVNYSVNFVAGHTYTWTLIGAANFTGQGNNSISVNWGPAGFGSLQVIETDLNLPTNCSSESAIFNVTLIPRPIPAITVNPPNTNGICQGQSAVYTTESGMSGYSWVIPAGATITGGGITTNSVTLRWETPGAKTITANYKNINGCYGLEPGASVTVVVHPLPDVAISQPVASAICQDYPELYLYGTQIIDPTATYNWSIPLGNGAISPNTSSNPIEVKWLASGNAQLKVIATTANGCIDALTIPIAVKAKPAVSFSPCFDKATILNGNPIRLKGGHPLGDNGKYYIGQPFLNPATYFTPSSIGVNNIYFSYTNYDGCITVSAPVTITVHSPSAFFSYCGGLITDMRETPPKTYKTVQIGSQCWMQENLRYGSTVSFNEPQTDNCIFERNCLSADPDCSANGGFYQWDELMQYDGSDRAQGFCPPGWHIPNESEWNTMILNVSGGMGEGVAGSFMKDTNTYYSFKGKPAGIFYLNNLQTFTGSSLRATFFWTSTFDAITQRATARGLNITTLSVSRYESAEANAFPVRCVKD
ncbi:MAG: hypothetical protein NT004_17550 [Bacteroidetes bacterium]|nr:hypothetical protein [Bacteroidota bacterium]